MNLPVRILMVDDDPDILAGTARLLEKAGYTVDRAASGEEALLAARNHRPDLWLLDHDLPGINGTEVCRQIKRDPALADSLVVIVSALHAESDQQAEGLELGADGYIGRPIGNRELLARVQAYVRIQRLTRSLHLQAEELKQSHEAANQAHRATHRLMADAVAARKRLEIANQALQSENTARKLAEAAREETLSRLQRIASRVPGVVYQFRLRPDGTASVPYASDGFREIYRISPEEVRENAAPAFACHHPDDHASILASIRQSAQDLTPWRHEFRVRFDDGTVRWLAGNAVPQREVDGTTLWHGFISDITERRQAEAALTHSHDLMRYIIEHCRSAIAVHDRDMKYVYVSQRYLQDYQVKEKDVIGKHHYEVFPDLPQKWRAVHQKALAGEISCAEDDPYVREDGTVDWTRWECRPWYEGDGSIGGIIIYTEVITQRKRLEEANTRLAAAVEQAGETIVITDPQGIILYVNAAFEKVSGYTRAEVLGQNSRLLKSGKQDAEVYRLLWDVLKRGQVWHGHFCNKRKDGELYEEDATIAPVRDDQGRIVNYVAVKRDVTRELELAAQFRQA
jgi:PAS domain S-box-containing protein